jgi:hypothetical protein
MVRIITVGAALLVLAASVAAGVGTAGSTGSCHLLRGSGQATFGGEQRTFAFTARKYADGSVKGEAQLNNRAQDRRFHMSLDCPRRERQQGVYERRRRQLVDSE